MCAYSFRNGSELCLSGYLMQNSCIKKISAKSPSKEPSANIFFHGRGKAVAGSAVSCQSHPTSRINTTALEYAGNLTENPFPMSSAPVTVTSMRPSVSVRRYVAVGRKP